MDLQQSITKAFSVTALLGLTLGPEDKTQRLEATSPSPERSSPTVPSSEPAPTPSPESRSLDANAVCGEGMILVDGEACPGAEQVCLKWLDPPPYQRLRCAEYAKPSVCKGPRVHRRFCIDREEYAERTSSGEEPLPVVNKSWLEAKAICEQQGKRLCKEWEWEFACEGPEAIPYPYGYVRDATKCNLDRTDLGGPMQKLTDHRAPSSAFPDCKSPFGVRNMVGNVDEWVEREGTSAPYRSALRGGWWLPGRNRCRAATLAHTEEYFGKQVGFRCCKDAPAAQP